MTITRMEEDKDEFKWADGCLCGRLTGRTRGVTNLFIDTYSIGPSHVYLSNRGIV